MRNLPEVVELVTFQRKWQTQMAELRIADTRAVT
jgi:hypothetical protein